MRFLLSPPKSKFVIARNGGESSLDRAILVRRNAQVVELLWDGAEGHFENRGSR